jgi:hypothetical protein
MTAEWVLRAVLSVLATYHLGIGAVSVISPAAALRVGRSLYAIDATGTAQLYYAVRMLGLYALAVGALLVPAVLDPRAHLVTIVVVAALQLARALCRVFFRADLAGAFALPARRNAANTAILMAEASVLLLCLPLIV